MKLCIIAPKNSKSALSIKLAAEKRGHDCKRARLGDVYFEVKNNELHVAHRKIELNDFDAFIFRTFNQVEKEEALALGKYLSKKGKKVIDSCLTTSCLNHIELIEKLTEANVPQVDKVRTFSLKSARDVLMEFAHPILVRPLEDSKERYTASEDWTDSYDIVRTEKSKKFEFQALLQTDNFLRVYIVGDKVLGCIKKTVLDDDARLNYAEKFKNEKGMLSSELESIALKAAKALGYQIASVDIVVNESKPYVLDVSRSPKFKTFNKYHDIKIEDEIIEYLEGI